jgi:hypothetical protein
LLRLATAEHLPCARVLGMAQESSGPTLVEVLGVSPKIDGFYMVLSFVSRVLPCFFKVFSKKSSFFQGFALFSKRKFNVNYIYSGQRWMVLLLDAASKIVK